MMAVGVQGFSVRRCVEVGVFWHFRAAGNFRTLYVMDWVQECRRV